MQMNLLNIFCRITLTVILLFTTSNLFGASANAVQRRALEQKFLQTTNADDLELTLGKPIERTLAGNEAHSYKIVLAANQYLHVIVKQRGIDVVVALFAPDGKKVAEVDSPNGTQGLEPISFVAETAGNYRLEVRSPELKVEDGRYQVKITEIREATTHDRNRLAAQQIYEEALNLENQGTAESRRQAIAKYEELLNLHRAVDNRGEEAKTLRTLGSAYAGLSEKHKALDYYNQALLIFQAENNRDGEGSTLNDIGIIYKDFAENQKALDYFKQGLTVFQTSGDSIKEGRTLRVIGAIYDKMNDKLRAFDYFHQALKLFKAKGNRRWEAATLLEIAKTYHYAGELQKALDYHLQSLSIFQSLNNSLSLNEADEDEADALIDIGLFYFDAGKKQEALDSLNKALDTYRNLKILGGDAVALVNISLVYSKFGDHQKAKEHAEQALILFQAKGDRTGQAAALNIIGTTYSNLNQQSKGLEYFQKALSILRADKRNFGAENFVLFNISRSERAQGNFVTALSHAQAIVDNLETIRNKINIRELRSTYFATFQNYYELYIDILMRLHKQQPKEGYDAKALQASERARARSLLETLAEANADIRQGVDTILLERERSVQQLLAGKSERLTRISNDEKLKAQKAAAQKEVDELLAQYQEIEAQIRVKSPRYAALTQPVPSDLTEIQRLLDKDTVLLEYSLGEERSYLWLITPQSLKSYELPKRSLIEETANRLISAIIVRNNPSGNSEAEYRKYQVAVKQADADYPKVSAELSRIILGQIAAEIEGKRLLIVGDGALQYVPFAALEGGSPNSKKRLLIETNEIVSLPSASTLAVLRREEIARQDRKTNTKTVAVFADPVFDADDKRVSADVKSNGAENKSIPNGTLPVADVQNAVFRSMNDVGLNSRGGLRRLGASRDEAEAIRNAAGDGQATIALGFNANRERVMTGNFADYRIVHFATHGLLNEENPELSGVVLSLVDAQGKPQNGFLRLNEIYNLNLPVEMVVLSACETGLGKKIKGEGLVGLTRGFMYAGAPRVVASLWSVDDFATKELMQIFYQKMLRENLSPAAALRAAQNEIRSRQQWQSPVYWAGFVLQGEWRKTVPNKK